MVPNFCVNLEPDKFHTVAHFKKKKVLFPFGEYSVYLKGEKKNPLLVSNGRRILCALSRSLEDQRVGECRRASSMCVRRGDAGSRLCDSSAPRSTVGPVRTPPPPRKCKRLFLPHVPRNLCPGLSTQPGLCEPALGAFLCDTSSSFRHSRPSRTLPTWRCARFFLFFSPAKRGKKYQKFLGN